MQTQTTLPVTGRPYLSVDQRNHVTIASIWPKRLFREEKHCAYVQLTGEAPKLRRMTLYEIGAGAESMTEAPKNVQLLRVHDTFCLYEFPETKAMQELPIMARSAGQGLVDVWSGVAGGARPSGTPGIMLLGGDEPTDEEIARLMQAQAAYFTRLTNRAETNARQGQMHMIGEVDRIAARWLNMHTRYSWYPMVSSGSTKTCLLCRGSLPMDAISCPSPGCGDLVTKALQGYWTPSELEEKDPFLAERVKLIRQRKADRLRKKRASKAESGD